jgi:adenosine deaminase
VRRFWHPQVGFDIAGAEKGFPPTRQLDAFEYVRQQNAHVTIHAGRSPPIRTEPRNHTPTPATVATRRCAPADQGGRGRRVP